MSPSSDFSAPIPAMPVAAANMTDHRFEERDRFRFDEGGHTMRTMLEILNRRRGVIIGCVALLTAATAGAASLLPHRYVSESLLILATRHPEIFQQTLVESNLVSGSMSDPAIVRSEVALLSSPAYARKVIERLDLLHNPVFRAEADSAGMRAWPRHAIDRLDDYAARVKSWLSGQPVTTRAASEVPPKAELIGDAILAFSKHLGVYNDDRSYAIRLSYESRDPAFAAEVVNTLGQIYVQDQLHAKQDAVRAALTWLNQQTENLRVKVNADEREVAEFEQSHHLETVLNGNVTEQRLSELNAQLIAATADRAQKEAALKQAQDMTASADGDAAVAQVLASPLIQSLRHEEAQVAGQVAALRRTYGAAYPAVAEGESHEREIQRRITEEIDRVSAGLVADVSAARLREAGLQEGLHTLQAELDNMNSARVELSELQRKATVGRNLYASLLQRAQQVESEAQSQQPDARLVPAEVPVQPSAPKTALLTGFGFFGSALLGLWLAFVIDRLDETVRTPEDAERLTDVPTLGIVPRVRNEARALAALVDRPLSTYSEAINRILVALRIADRRGVARVIAVTSALPGEGKTLVAGSLARAAAARGIRTLLVDCDMRRPAVARLFGEAGAPPLNRMCSEGRTDSQAFALKEELSGLYYLPVGESTRNPQEVVGSSWMGNLISRAREDYDLVVLDTPPLLAVSETLLLSRLADATLLAVHWGRTPRRAVSNAVRLLQVHGAHPLGTVLSRVDLRKYRKYRNVAYHYANTTQRHLISRDAY